MLTAGPCPASRLVPRDRWRSSTFSAAHLCAAPGELATRRGPYTPMRWPTMRKVHTNRGMPCLKFNLLDMQNIFPYNKQSAITIIGEEEIIGAKGNIVRCREAALAQNR